MNHITSWAATSVQRQLAIVVGVASMLFLATARTVWQYLAAASADARIVNVAGRQRMLTQRMAREALATARGHEDAPGRLGAAADEFDRSLRDLMHGSEARGLPAAPRGARSHLDAVANRWPQVAEATRVLATPETAAFEQHGALAAILANADPLLRETDDVVAYFDEEFTRKVRRLRTRLSLVGITGAATLGATYVVLLAGARRRAERAEEAVRSKEAQLQELAEERRELVQRLLNATEDERRRVAADIHDGPTQQLTGAAMLLEVALEDDPGSDASRHRVETAKSYLDGALQETRRIIANLRPPALEDLGVAEALRRDLLDMARPFAVAVEVESRLAAIPDARPAPQTEAALYRVAQEAVMNALKHSGATHVRVTLDACDGGIALAVRDNGCGFDPTTVAVSTGHRPLGLLGMRERVEALGGHFAIESAPSEGANIRAWVPAEVQP